MTSLSVRMLGVLLATVLFFSAAAAAAAAAAPIHLAIEVLLPDAATTIHNATASSAAAAATGGAGLVDLAQRELHRYTTMLVTSDYGPHVTATTAADSKSSQRLRLALLLVRPTAAAATADLRAPQQQLSRQAAAAVAAACSPPLASSIMRGDLAEPEAHVVELCGDDSPSGRHGAPHFMLAGTGERGLLYAAYRFAELALHVSFSSGGDRLPAQAVGLAELLHRARGSVAAAAATSSAPAAAGGRDGSFGTVATPRFGLRGIQPFHDFREGPDWWSQVLTTDVCQCPCSRTGQHSVAALHYRWPSPCQLSLVVAAVWHARMRPL